MLRAIETRDSNMPHLMSLCEWTAVGALVKGEMDGGTGKGTFSLTKGEALLRDIRDRKLWRALIAYDLKGRGTSKKVKF